ncbi:MAG: formylglycine-generating enzyme family protein [Candidatus Cloacimonetes bacterium]|nr:formylglycine-generating enzyme family protein [Candidatus Cloacimonadota bacterium]
MKYILIIVLVVSGVFLFSNEPPEVSNFSVEQRDDGTYLVDIYYDVEDADSDLMYVELRASMDEGATWVYQINSLTGDFGLDIASGNNKHIVWDFAGDHPESLNIPAMIKITADDRNLSFPAMTLIQAGSFQMGDTHGLGQDDELPVHTVNLSDYYVGTYEITHHEILDVFNWAMHNNHLYYNGMELFNAYGDMKELIDLNDVDCAIGIWDNELIFFGNGYAASPECPCIEITWYGAAAFCNFLSLIQNFEPCYDFVDWSCDFGANGYRLPTEAEWEYAARGGTDDPDYIYPGSDNCYEVAWFSGNSTPNTHISGLKQANGSGIYDMSGNVWEWCCDWYSATYYNISPADNPTGPEIGTGKVVRGASFSNDDSFCRLAFRGSVTPFSGNENRGFRVCQTVIR